MTPQRLLVLNYEDDVKIKPILQNPPSETKVVASNLRFTCWNYYDYLQLLFKAKKGMDDDELGSLFNKATNGSIVTLYDIANLYTKELGIKTVPWNGEKNLTNLVNRTLNQYYQQDGVFDNWIKTTTVWAFANRTAFSGINQPNENFVLDFTTEGNTLTYMPR